MLTVICGTEECENYGEALELPSFGVDPFTGEEVPVVRVECGPCRNEITNVSPPLHLENDSSPSQ